MGFHLRNLLARAKPFSPKDSKANGTEAADSTDATSLYSNESLDMEETKRQAYQERRARQAEEYLCNHGFVSATSNPPSRAASLSAAHKHDADFFLLQIGGGASLPALRR